MKTFIRTTLVAVLLLAGGSLFAQVPIIIGPPPPPRVIHVLPPRPSPEFTWINGYWYPVGGRYVWHEGYWTRPPYPGAYWVVPRHEGGRYYGGYWDGTHGRFEHDHRWDYERDRDFDRHHH